MTYEFDVGFDTSDPASAIFNIMINAQLYVKTFSFLLDIDYVRIFFSVSFSLFLYAYSHIIYIYAARFLITHIHTVLNGFKLVAFIFSSSPFFSPDLLCLRNISLYQHINIICVMMLKRAI